MKAVIIYRELKLNHDCRFAAKQSEIVSMRFGRAGIHNIKTRTGAVGETSEDRGT